MSLLSSGYVFGPDFLNALSTCGLFDEHRINGAVKCPCGRPSVRRTGKCGACRAIERTQANTTGHYIRRKGTCGDCGGPTSDKRVVQCVTCRRTIQADTKKSGKCVDCEIPLSDHRCTRCKPCAARVSRSRRAA